MEPQKKKKKKEKVVPEIKVVDEAEARRPIRTKEKRIEEEIEKLRSKPIVQRQRRRQISDLCLYILCYFVTSNLQC